MFVCVFFFFFFFFLFFFPPREKKIVLIKFKTVSFLSLIFLILTSSLN